MLRTSIVLVIAASTLTAFASDIKMDHFTYASSVDKTAPLQADVAYDATGKPKPLVVVMHGYNGSKKDMSTDIQQLAGKGLFAIAPDMRSAGGSAGKFDSGGVEIHDILDAVLAAIDKFPREIDAKNLNIVGYSGGGGNAISCAVRFPDLFQTNVSFFGISDYAMWNRSNGRPDCNRRMELALGGGPDAVPEVYAARNANAAAGNALVAKLHFFWDEQETACPASMIEEFLKTYHAAGLKNAKTSITKYGDKHRWKHANRSANKSLEEADAIFLPDMLAPRKESPKLPPKGKLTVNGYLVTRKFQVWIEDGQKGQVTISYDTSGAKPIVKVVENPKNYKVRIEDSVLGKLP